MKYVKKILKFVAAITLLGLVTIAFTPPADRYFEIAKNIGISLHCEVNALYVDESKSQSSGEKQHRCHAESLKLTNYIPEDQVEDFRTMNTGRMVKYWCHNMIW